MYPGYQRFFPSCGDRLSSNGKDLTEPDKTLEKSPALRGGGMHINADVCLWKHDKRKQRCWSRLRLCRLLFWSANFCVLKIQSSSSRRHIFQILDKVNNIIQVHGMSSQLSCRGRGVFLGILSGALLHGSLNPHDPISDQKCHFSHPFSDPSPKNLRHLLYLD